MTWLSHQPRAGRLVKEFAIDLLKRSWSKLHPSPLNNSILLILSSCGIVNNSCHQSDQTWSIVSRQAWCAKASWEQFRHTRAEAAYAIWEPSREIQRIGEKVYLNSNQNMYNCYGFGPRSLRIQKPPSYKASQDAVQTAHLWPYIFSITIQVKSVRKLAQ